jgi:hypothetical protein
MTLRLVALDLDGTLLDPYGKLTPAVRAAVARLAQHELRVVLCTGRRFRTALPLAQALELDGAIVVHNGVVVKDLASGKTLQHHYLAPEVVGEVIEHVRSHGPPLVYLDTYHEGMDIVSERLEAAHPFQRAYLDDQAEFLRIVADVGAGPHEPGVIMVSTMADEPALARLRAAARERFGARVLTHSLINKNYQGSILEFLSPEAGKWPALERLAASWGIAPEEIAAVGDDTNDAEVLRHAGLGIAMGNARPEVREAARRVVRSNAEGGAIEAVEAILAAL